MWITYHAVFPPTTTIGHLRELFRRVELLYQIKSWPAVYLHSHFSRIETIDFALLSDSKLLIHHDHCWTKARSSAPAEKPRDALLANVNVSYMSSSVRLSSVCLSVVCNVRAPYSGDCNVRQCFYAIWYLGHLWPFGKNFTEIVPGEPLRRRVKPKRGRKM